MKYYLTLSVYTLLLFSLLSGANAFAVDPGLDWKTIQSDHIYVHFSEGYKDIAERALVIAEAAHQRHTTEFNWQPRERTHIVISDQSDFPNGYATPVFFNRAVLFIAPPTSVNTLEDFDDWFTTLIVHEYAHIIHLDKSAGSPEYLRTIFGRFLFLFPNAFQPSWVTEGLATYKETDAIRGIGRGQSAMFASMMRQEVVNGLQPISHVNLPVSTWPAGTTRYLYGVYFMSFFVERYGEEKLQEWIEEYSDNLFPFFINTTASQVVGEQLTPIWQEYQQWLSDRFQPQIDAIEAGGIKAGKQVSVESYRTDSPRVISTDKGDEVYYVRNGGYRRADLMLIDSNGEIQELAALNGSATIDLHPDAGLLLTQNEFCNNYTVFSDIYKYDKVHSKLKRLTECGRYLYVSWFPDGKHMAAVQFNAGHFALQLLDEEAGLQKTLWQGNDSDIVGQIDVAPDGKNIVASIWRKGGGWNLELFDVSEKHWKKITTGTSVKVNPQFDSAGNILFSMEADEVYNLYRYDIKTENVERLTNVIGGAFQSSQADNGGSIYYTGYGAQGYAIYKLEETSMFAAAPAFKEDQLKVFDYQLASHQQSDYSALSNMYPRWWFPEFRFSEQRSEIGLTTQGGDALGIHNYSISATYDTKLQRPAAKLRYLYADRIFLTATRINDINLKANGELSRILNRSTASAVLAFPNRYIKKQHNFLLSVVYDNTAEDGLSAGTVPLDDFEDHLLGAAWLYNSTDLNPLSINIIDGMKIRLVAEDSDSLNSDFSGQVYTLDWRQYIRTGRESLIALRFLQGWGTDQPRSFKLGGEGFNEDAISILFANTQEPVFNQRNYALRGYKEGLPQLRGRRAQMLSGEWHFPFERIEKGIMTPPVAIMQWFGTVFVETGSAYRDSPGSYYSSAGFELTADINLFYSGTLRTRLGYAHGFDSKIGDDLIYLRIGNSF